MFEKAITEGQFIFIFDAFDEVKQEARSKIELFLYQYMDTENILIISNRKNDVISANNTVDLFEILPLDLNSAIQIISRIDFDNKVKRKFIKGLKTEIYSTHRSFASRPLLLTMMLLSFDQYADIPHKMHIFYDQAFDVLFSRHDALKETFHREKQSKLTIDRFKAVFSYFCLLTYNDRINEFSQSQSLEYIRKAAKFSGDEFAAEDFFNDLYETVNVIHKEGLKFVFSHRSFQEYFTAYCILRIGEHKAHDILVKIANRPTDNVFPMLYDMNKIFVGRVYIDHFNEQYTSKTKEIKRFSLRDFTEALDMAIVISPTFRQKISPKKRTKKSISASNTNVVCAITSSADLANARFIVYRLLNESSQKDAHDTAMLSDIGFERADLSTINSIVRELDEKFSDVDFMTIYYYKGNVSLIAKRENTEDFIQESFNIGENTDIQGRFFDFIERLSYVAQIEQKHVKTLENFSEIRAIIDSYSTDIDQILK